MGAAQKLRHTLKRPKELAPVLEHVSRKAHAHLGRAHLRAEDEALCPQNQWCVWDNLVRTAVEGQRMLRRSRCGAQQTLLNVAGARPVYCVRTLRKTRELQLLAHEHSAHKPTC